MTTKNKIYFGVIALGLAALCVDRLFLGATVPQASKAEDIDEMEAQSPAPVGRSAAAPPKTGPKRGIPELHFPRNLKTYDPRSPLRDVFAPPRGGNAAAAPGGQTAIAEGAEPGAIGRADFGTRHKVDAILVNERLKIAVVDGRWLREGDSIDQCVLMRIEGSGIIFQCHDGDTLLSPVEKRNQPQG